MPTIYPSTAVLSTDGKSVDVSVVQPDGQLLKTTIPTLPPISTLKATPSAAQFIFKEGQIPPPIEIKITGPIGVISYWSDQWNYCSVEDSPKKIPCSYLVAPNAAMLGAKAGTTSAFNATVTAGTSKISVPLMLEVAAADTIPVPPTPVPGPTNGEPAITALCGAPGMLWTGPVYVASFASDGIESVTFACGALSAKQIAMVDHPTWINRMTGSKIKLWQCPFVGSFQGLNSLKVTVRTKGGNVSTWSYPLFVGSNNPDFQLIENQHFDGSLPSAPNNVKRLFRNCTGINMDRVARYLPDGSRPDYFESCQFSGPNPFRNAGGTVNCDVDGCNDDSYSNVRLMVACSDKNHAPASGGHPDVNQFEFNPDGVIVYGCKAQVDSQGLSFSAATNVAVVDFYHHGSGRWSFYAEGSAKNSDGHVNQVRNMFWSNVDMDGPLSWSDGGGTPAKCVNVVFEKFSRANELAASGVVIR